jgi:hypothetical protein
VAKAATSGEQQDFPTLPSGVKGSHELKDLSALIQGLRPFDEESIGSSVRSTESKVSNRRLASRALSKGVVKPLLALKENICVLPSSVKNSQNHIGHYMLEVCKRLGIKTVETPYAGPIQDLSEFQENVGVGVFMSLDDGGSNFNIKRKTDPYEAGRTLARSQQIMGCILDLGHKNDILKPNHYYFGNNPGETIKVDKQVLRVNSFKTELLSYIIEKDWAHEMSDILIKLLRRSYVLMPHDTIYQDMKPQLITYTQVISRWCSSERVVTPAKGKKKAQTVRKVPGKPKSSPLLTKSEMELLNSLSSRLFGKTSMEELEFNDWCALLLNEGLETIRSRLKIIYNNRQIYLTRFAKLTTNRLSQVRKLPGVYPTTKKASVTTEQVAAVILTREDPVSALVQEILTIDPSGELFIDQYFAGDTTNYAASTLSESDLRSLLSKIVVDKQVYDDLRKTKDSQDPWVLRYLELERAHRITKMEFDELRKKIRQSDKRRKVEVQKDITLFDLIKDKVNVTMQPSRGTIKHKVPHDVKKPQGAGNVPQPQKGKQIAIDPSESWGYDKLISLYDELQDSVEEQSHEEKKENLEFLDEHPEQKKLMHKLAHDYLQESTKSFINSAEGMAIIRHMLLNIG